MFASEIYLQIRTNFIIRTTYHSLGCLNCPDTSMVFVHSSFREKHSSQIRVEHDTRSTEAWKARGCIADDTKSGCTPRSGREQHFVTARFAKRFLLRSYVPLGGSSDPLRTRRAQDADAAF